MKISIKRHETNGSYMILLSGTMDSYTLDILDELNTYEKIETCIFDFKDLVKYELEGVMQWLNFTCEFYKNKKIIFKNCRSNWMMLIHQIPQLIENVVLQSVIAEYICPECDDFTEKLFESSNNIEKVKLELKQDERCENCMTGNIEITETEEELFFHLITA